MLTYEEFAQLPISEKSVLCIVEANTQYKIFNLVGSVYKKQVQYFVSGVSIDGVPLDKGDLATLAPGEFYFDGPTKTLSLRTLDDANPKTKSLVCTHKFFFSNNDHILPHDLADGEEVEFENRVESIGNIGQQLDDENTGIVLESSSQITLMNQDGFFDKIFDTLVWENRTIEFFSWSPKIPIEMSVKLFSGVIESKTFTEKDVVFKVKDFVYKLRNLVALSNFSDADGTLGPSMIGRPKRRIYGQVKQVETAGLDLVLDGFSLTGTISVAENSTALTGTSTQFLRELSPGDELFVIMDDGSKVKISLDSITGDNAAVLGQEAPLNITNKTAKVKPKYPVPFKNRKWHIAGHPLVAPVTTIIQAVSARRFIVDNIDDFYEGDLIQIGSENHTIKRISNREIITNQSLLTAPTAGTVIEKRAASKVYFGSKELAFIRDWTMTNFGEAIIVLDEDAEFNVANPRSMGVNLTFTHNSRTITTTSTIDLRTLVKPRDWIRKTSLTEPDWFEILDVREQTITLRMPYFGTTQTTTAKMKNVDYVVDDSLITVDCVGKQYEDHSTSYIYKWIRTPSDAVRDLILNDAGFTDINEESFAQAKADCNFILSLVIPENLGDDSPSVRDVISKINDSVFGSLYGDKTSRISFSVLNSRKPTSLKVIQDHDILSWSSSTEQKIVNKVKVNFRPYMDYFTEQSSYHTVEHESDFVDQMIGIQNSEERMVYLYEEDKALIIAQRLAFYRSLSNCKVTLKGKLGLALTAVNDKMYIEFDRLFHRYGGSDNKKISIVTGVRKNGMEVEIDMIDLGNVFNRVPSIAPISVPSYATASRDDAVKYGFILDNDTLTPDNTLETDLGNNRIG